MKRDYFHRLLSEHVEAGAADPAYWWDEDRIPLSSIDKRASDLMDLTGKRAVVTGGAGMNLGQACVNRLAGMGAEVVVVDLAREAAEASGHQRWAQPPDAHAVAAAAAERWGTRVLAVHGDVMTWDGAAAVLEESRDLLGGIDILVNNAADVAVGDFATMSAEDIDRSVRGTLTGPLYCTRLALDHMIAQGTGGRIINIGSEAGQTAMPGLTLYGALKSGLGTFTRFLSKEVAEHGIHVLGVNAGSMWGPGRAVPADGPATLYSRSRTAIQRYELPEEVANMVAFLASDAASAMTGTMVDMGGGMSV
ncbi:SDR family oxidoreductase [Nocardioides sp. QY071]|uniref:SDR family NAD(P)-dependent oxidoreductase n=1 Tax=Nocardioides sp. QY071 TaxID=3044187 RepID=UPI00249C9836|nr:SDR family oxidoreductase [Nocardioides sp. QY071]WGY00363.1 SDR family oxidoreductase [Nocardioides sp. QY071]